MQAHTKMSNFESAIDDYKALLNIRPNNSVVQKEMELARRGLADMKQREKSMFYMMFDKVRPSSVAFPVGSSL